MEDWSSYRPAHFVLYGPEVWLRLVERAHEFVGYWGLLGPLAGLLAAALVLAGRWRGALPLLALGWLFCAYGFFGRLYAELSWVGPWLAGVFLAQALLLLLALLGRPAPASTAARWGLRGAAVGAGGLLATLGFALLGPASGAGWPRAEVFGLHPDPTALITLALLPGLPGGWRRGLLALIPLLWLALSALHLQVLQAAWWPLVLLAAGASLLGLLLVGLRDRGAAPH